MDRGDSKRIQVLGALESLWQHPGGPTILVGQVMTADPYCVSPETTLPEVVDVFHERNFRHLLVTGTEGQLHGVISDRDVLRMLGPGTAYKEVFEGVLAGEIMSTDIVKVGSQTPAADAVVSMIDNGISCLPVVDEGRLLGIVTSTDLHVLLQMLLQTLRTTGSEKPVAADPG